MVLTNSFFNLIETAPSFPRKETATCSISYFNPTTVSHKSKLIWTVHFQQVTESINCCQMSLLQTGIGSPAWAKQAANWLQTGGRKMEKGVEFWKRTDKRKLGSILSSSQVAGIITFITQLAKNRMTTHVNFQLTKSRQRKCVTCWACGSDTSGGRCWCLQLVSVFFANARCASENTGWENMNICEHAGFRRRKSASLLYLTNTPVLSVAVGLFAFYEVASIYFSLLR